MYSPASLQTLTFYTVLCLGGHFKHGDWEIYESRWLGFSRRKWHHWPLREPFGTGEEVIEIKPPSKLRINVYLWTLWSAGSSSHRLYTTVHGWGGLHAKVCELGHHTGDFIPVVQPAYLLLRRGLLCGIAPTSMLACTLRNATACSTTSWYFLPYSIFHTMYWHILNLFLAY